MAVVTNDITFYNKNILRSLPNWNILSKASVNGDYINISSGGIAGIDLSNNYNNGLKASKYRQVIVEVQADITEQNNYQNYIEVILRGVYKDNEGNNLEAFFSVNATLLSSKLSDGVLTFNRVISLDNFDFNTCTVYVANHTLGNIVLRSCIMKRSQDISSSQVGESIGYNIVLNEAIAYIDGCELYYDGVEKPDKLWELKDNDGNFIGINVNNDRMIKFSRKNEVLID